MRSLLPSARALAYTRRQSLYLMTSLISITRPTKPTFNSATGMITATAQTIPIYQGIAHIYSIRGGLQSVGDDMMVLTQTQVSIPWIGTVAPKVDDIITVVADDDPDLQGKIFRIVDNTAEGGIENIVRSMAVTGVDRDAFTH